MENEWENIKPYSRPLKYSALHHVYTVRNTKLLPACNILKTRYKVFCLHINIKVSVPWSTAKLFIVCKNSIYYIFYYQGDDSRDCFFRNGVCLFLWLWRLGTVCDEGTSTRSCRVSPSSHIASAGNKGPASW